MGDFLESLMENESKCKVMLEKTNTMKNLKFVNELMQVCLSKWNRLASFKMEETGHSAVCRKDWGMLQLSFESFSDGFDEQRQERYIEVLPISRARVDILCNWMAPFCKKMNLSESFKNTWSVEYHDAVAKEKVLSNRIYESEISSVFEESLKFERVGSYLAGGYESKDFVHILRHAYGMFFDWAKFPCLYNYAIVRFLKDEIPVALMDETKILAYLTLARILKPHRYEEEKAQILEKWNACQKEYAPEDLLNLCLKEHREELIRTMEATEFESPEVLVYKNLWR